MIYYLTANAADLEDVIDGQAEELIGSLVRASLEGHHKIILGRSICSWSIDNLDLGGREKAHLRRLRNDFSQIGQLALEAPCSIQVLIGDQPLEEVAKHKYNIGHIALLRSNYLSEAELLVEHIENDCDLLEVVFNRVKRNISISQYHYRRSHGGGGDIVTCFEHSVKEKRITVCVHDSDRKAPSDTKSHTARRLRAEGGKQTYVGDVIETRGHEAENTIPMAILNEHRQRICPQYPDFDKLERLLNAQNVQGYLDCLWLFFDIKKGLNSEKVKEIANPAVSDWISEKFLEGEQSLDDLNISGFGDKILQQFLNCGAAVRDFVAHIATPDWTLHFAGFFEEILWYFVSDKRRAVA